jgi:type 1 fimbria pilin
MNKGASSLQNIAISAIVDSSFVDWSTLVVSSGGKLKDGTITWTKDEVPSLAEIKPGQEGDLNFSVRLKKFASSDLGNNFQVKSYAKFNINNNTSDSELNRSNLITSRLNSDLVFSEKVLYFDENNSPVGEGPLPPEVGEKTLVRVYWNLKNTLHELDKARVSLDLPPNTSFAGLTKIQAGNIYYDQASNQVVWEIGRIPLSVTEVKGEFSLSLIPTPNDRNKILVISPGATVSAIDLDNNAEIKLNSSPKTTKLEDDDIAALSNSGKIQ